MVPNWRTQNRDWKKALTESGFCDFWNITERWARYMLESDRYLDFSVMNELRYHRLAEWDAYESGKRWEGASLSDDFNA